MLSFLQTQLRNLAKRNKSYQLIFDATTKKENTMSFWSTLEADVNKGLEVAAVLVGSFLPSEGTLLTDIAEVIADIESVFAKPASQAPAATVSAAVQSATTLSAIKQAAVAKKATS
jgi:hypothetical protein